MWDEVACHMPHVRYDKNGLNSYHLSAYLFVFDFFTCVFLVQFYFLHLDSIAVSFMFFTRIIIFGVLNWVKCNLTEFNSFLFRNMSSHRKRVSTPSNATLTCS